MIFWHNFIKTALISIIHGTLGIENLYLVFISQKVLSQSLG